MCVMVMLNLVTSLIQPDLELGFVVVNTTLVAIIVRNVVKVKKKCVILKNQLFSGFVQKKWSQSSDAHEFQCERKSIFEPKT